VETEGYACREIYVDTFKVNFSAAAEEVAAMFRVRLVPVSAGTPQEMAYAESAVRVIGEMSRSLMAGAPHLDECCWGLADVQAAYIHNFMPQQSKEDMSPYERKTFRTPDLDAMFVRVFGCPAQYEPYGGALHKRGKKTEWGYFVGVQWPMALILRPDDGKVISVSRKKILCHEEIYATFDSSKGMTPATSVDNFKLNLDNVKGEVEGLTKISDCFDKVLTAASYSAGRCLSRIRIRVSSFPSSYVSLSSLGHMSNRYSRSSSNLSSLDSMSTRGGNATPWLSGIPRR
jgi:hypothetical protein